MPIRSVGISSIAVLSFGIASCGGSDEVADDGDSATTAESSAVASSATNEDAEDAATPVARAILLSDGFDDLAEPILQVNRFLLRRDTADCMREIGFDYPRPDGFVQPDPRIDLRYGLASADVAGEFGYAFVLPEIPQYPSVPAEDLENPDFVLALDGAENEQLTDTLTLPEGKFTYVAEAGCRGEAIKAVHGSREAFLEFLKAYNRAESLGNESLAELRKSPEYQSIVSEWKACMAQAGYEDAEDPADIDIALGTEQESVDQAIEDVRCKDSVDFVQRASSIESVWQELERDRFLSDLETLSSTEDRLFGQIDEE